MRTVFSFLLLLFIPFAHAQEPQIIQGQLENGLRYTLLPMHDQPERINVIMRVYAGGIDESDSQSGVAHMVEHMAFRTSQKHTNGVMPYLHQQGWLRGKNYNAFTTHDHTTYIYLPPKAFGLENTLDVMREMLFHAAITQKDWDDERKIVLEEWRSRSSVRRRMWEQQINSTRAFSRYANRPVIGSEQSILTMPAAELQKYYQQWYVPNNMQLLIAGDFDSAQAKAMVQDYFAQFQSQTLPDRTSTYEPTLTNTLRVDKLSDPQNNRSQVSFLTRFEDGKTQTLDDNGFYQRLIDEMALGAINQRLREEKADLPKEISALSARKYLIGKTTSVFALNANVEKQSHAPALNFMLEQLARFAQYPISEDELALQKSKWRDQLQNARKNREQFSFDDWVQEAINTVLSDKTFYSQAEKEKLTEQGLAKITTQEVNERLQMWLTAQDRIAQYMPPFEEKVEPITVEMVQQWQKNIAQKTLTPPKNVNTQVMQLPALTSIGSITTEQRFPEQNVVHWQLSNGDKVVWLKSAVAKNKSYFVAQSNAGSYAENLTSWQAKLALQLIGQNAPLDWTRSQMLDWKERQHIPLIMRQSFNKLNVLSTVENEKLGEMLRFYYANQQETQIKEEFERVKTDFIRQLGLNQASDDYQRQLAWENFVYGKLLNPTPSVDEAEKLQVQDLMAQWQQITLAPATYFLVNDMGEDEVKSLITANLASIPRQSAPKVAPLLVQAGKNEQNFASNPEPKDNVYLSIMTPMKWQAEKAAALQLLSTIVSEKLGKAMRDDALGVYGVRFRSRLVEESEQLQTTLSFSANPENSRELLNLARQQLATLPESITQTELEKARKYLLEQNEQARKTADYWLSNLISSETHFQNPSHLDNDVALLQAVTLDDIKELAKVMYNEQNQRLFVTTPKGE